MFSLADLWNSQARKTVKVDSWEDILLAEWTEFSFGAFLQILLVAHCLLMKPRTAPTPAAPEGLPSACAPRSPGPGMGGSASCRGGGGSHRLAQPRRAGVCWWVVPSPPTSYTNVYTTATKQRAGGWGGC